MRTDSPTEFDEARIRAVLPEFPLRDQLLVELGFQTGLRISELLRLKIRNIWGAGEPLRNLQVERRLLKGGCGRRQRTTTGRKIPLNATAREAIQAALHLRVEAAAEDEPVFLSREGDGEPLSTRQAIRIVKKIFLAAGLDPSRVWASHSMRKRYAQRLYENTGDLHLVRAAIGHRWVTTTQAYVRVDDAQVEQAIMALAYPPNPVCRPSQANAI